MFRLEFQTSAPSLAANVTMSAGDYQTACLLTHTAPPVAGQHTFTVTLLPGRRVVNAGSVNIGQYLS